MRRLFFLAAAGLFLAACGAAATPIRQFTKGDELAYYDFTETGTFEEGIYADGEARFQIRDGVYSINLTEGDSVLWYGQWGAPLRDVVVDVEAQQFTQSQNTIYGAMCRVRGAVGQQVNTDPSLDALAADTTESAPLVAQADVTQEATDEAAEATSEATDEAADATPEADTTAEASPEAEETRDAAAEATEVPAEATPETPAPSAGSPNNGDGYLFLVNGAGQFAIMRSLGGSVSPLVDWTASGVVKPGADSNRIRAVCLGDYLAMYVNGTFVGDATDDTYTQGQVGLLGASGDRLGLLVQFDNLMVSAALP